MPVVLWEDGRRLKNRSVVALTYSPLTRSTGWEICREGICLVQASRGETTTFYVFPDERTAELEAVIDPRKNPDKENSVDRTNHLIDQTKDAELVSTLTPEKDTPLFFSYDIVSKKIEKINMKYDEDYSDPFSMENLLMQKTGVFVVLGLITGAVMFAVGSDFSIKHRF